MSDATETNKEQTVAAEATTEAAATEVVETPAADLTNEPREARRGGRERPPCSFLWYPEP